MSSCDWVLTSCLVRAADVSWTSTAPVIGLTGVSTVGFGLECQYVFRRTVIQRRASARLCAPFYRSRRSMGPVIDVNVSRQTLEVPGRLAPASPLPTGPGGNGKKAASGVLHRGGAAFRSGLRLHGATASGEVAEWSIASHSKCEVRATVPGVRIPPSPPSSVYKPLINHRFIPVPATIPNRIPNRRAGQRRTCADRRDSRRPKNRPKSNDGLVRLLSNEGSLPWQSTIERLFGAPA